jgi:hypothetical protein
MDLLIRQAIDGVIERSDADEYCHARDMQSSSLWNAMATFVAQAFQREEMSYSDADAALNSIWNQMVGDATRFGDGFELPEPAYSIYQAFDAGEYDHGNGDDSVEKYTKPEIDRILKDTQQNKD